MRARERRAGKSGEEGAIGGYFAVARCRPKKSSVCMVLPRKKKITGRKERKSKRKKKEREKGEAVPGDETEGTRVIGLSY